MRVWKRLGHDDRRSSVAAPDIGDFATGLELCFDTGQCGYPRSDKVSGVAGSEKFLSANKKVGVVVAPQQSAAVLERFGDDRLGVHHCFYHVETATDIKRAVLIGQCYGLSRQHR